LKFFADFPNTFKTATRCNSFAVIDELISEGKKNHQLPVVSKYMPFAKTKTQSVAEESIFMDI